VHGRAGLDEGRPAHRNVTAYADQAATLRRKRTTGLPRVAGLQGQRTRSMMLHSGATKMGNRIKLTPELPARESQRVLGSVSIMEPV